MAVTRNRRLLTGSFGPSGKVNYTLDDLENDDKFQGVAERFLESVGENSDDIFEYLRDFQENIYEKSFTSLYKTLTLLRSSSVYQKVSKKIRLFSKSYHVS